ncbi:GNAT superfamily N-acetyltransferase [Kluyvera sp. 1366]
MNIITFPGHTFEEATRDDIDFIVCAFTSRISTPYPSQRFPSDVEGDLEVRLMHAFNSTEQQLLLARSNNGESYMFMACSLRLDPFTLYMAGVWPEWRGKGIFSRMMEILRVSSGPINGCEIHLHPEMHVARRIISKVGFTVKSEDNDILILSY